MRRQRLLLTFLAVAVVALAVAVATLWPFGGPPNWVSWQSREIEGDAARGEPTRIALTDKAVTVFSEDAAAWQSPAQTLVQDALWCDIDHDGARELLLLTWRQGRYGESRPFWVTEEAGAREWSQHIDIYRWDGAALRPVWMASDIGLEAAAWRFDPVERLVITSRDGSKSAWDWRSWGLEGVALPERTVTFAALGEALIHRQIYEDALLRRDGSFDFLFEGVADVLADYDLISLHQETVLVDRPEDYGTFPVFGTPVELGQAVIGAGFDIVSCASNHALDKGLSAIDRTAQLYREAGIACLGIQPAADGAFRPYETLERNGITLALLSFTQTTNGHALPEEAPYALHTLDDAAAVRRAVEEARVAADAVVVYVHWGTEYQSEPDETQEAWAKHFADWGADVVLGTHPHVLQPWGYVTGESGRQALVYYSLGNFVSAQTEEACRLGGMAYFTLQKSGGETAVTDFGLRYLETQEENGHYFTTWAE